VIGLGEVASLVALVNGPRDTAQFPVSTVQAGEAGLSVILCFLVVILEFMTPLLKKLSNNERTVASSLMGIGAFGSIVALFTAIANWHF
jgi:hypothetical protein